MDFEQVFAYRIYDSTPSTPYREETVIAQCKIVGKWYLEKSSLRTLEG